MGALGIAGADEAKRRLATGAVRRMALRRAFMLNVGRSFVEYLVVRNTVV